MPYSHFFFLIDSFVNLWWLQASKAALISFFETLRVELGSDIGITIVTPGLIKSEMSEATKLSKVYCELNETRKPPSPTYDLESSLFWIYIRGNEVS